MMQHAPSRHHAAGRNDDAGRLHVVDGLRFLYRSGQVEVVNAQRIMVTRRFQLGEVQVVVVGIFHVQVGGAQRHRTVDVDGQVRNPSVIFELPQVVHECLSATDGESGNYDG